MAFIKNRVTEFEKELCMILAKLTHHVHPKIVERIQQKATRDDITATASLDSKSP